MKRGFGSALVITLLLSVNAMAINDQSLKSENTFGLLEDNFDLFFYPGYLSDFKGYEVYTNLHNTSSANRFQIGWFGLPESVPGKLFLMFDTTRQKTSNWVYLPAAGFTPAWPTFISPATFVGTGEQGFFNRAETDFFDDNGDYKSDRSILRNVAGEAWTENSQYEVLLGYGVPVNPKFSLGGGVLLGFNSGESRNSRSTFDISYIETDLNTGTVLENYSDKSEAKIDVGGSNIGFMVGAKFEPKEKTKIGVDVGYTLITDSGSGKYSSTQRNATWTRGVESATLSETLIGAVGDPAINGIQDALPSDGNNIGIRVKTYLPVVKNHTLRIDGALAITSRDVADGRKETRDTTSESNSVTQIRTDTQSNEVINYSGKNGSGTGYSLLLADVIDVTNLLRVALGIGFEQVKRTVDVKRAYSFTSVSRTDRNNDGDAIDAPLDYDPISGNYDERDTDESAYEQSYKNEVTTTYFKIPLAADVRLTKRLNLRLGASHFIIITRNDESTVLNSGSYQTKSTYEDGTGTRTVSYTAFAIPDDTKTSNVNTISQTDYRIGLGIEASKNLVIDLLANYWTNWDDDEHIHELSIEPHETTNIWSIFASATIRFD